MYIHMYIYIHIYIHKRIYIYKHMYIYMYILKLQNLGHFCFTLFFTFVYFLSFLRGISLSLSRYTLRAYGFFGGVIPI